MINIVYCPDHTGGEVVAAGACHLPATHTHGDATDHTCRVLVGVDEDYDPSGTWFADLKTTYGAAFDLS